MIVTELEACGKSKFKVYIDYEYAFQLSAREVRLYGIEKEHQISDVLYSEIRNEVLLPKAKLKAMDLLKSMDRTEYELMAKLKSAGFPEVISGEAIEYVKSYNYINDYRYACNYIIYKKSTKSLKMLQMELIRKGVDKTIIDQAIDEEYGEEMEEEAIQREIKKKCRNVEELTYEKKMRISASLFRKGYSSSAVRKVFGDLSFYED